MPTLPFNPYTNLAPPDLLHIMAQHGNPMGSVGSVAPNYQYHPGGGTPGGVHADYMQSLARLAAGEDPHTVWADYGKYHGSGGGRGFFGNLWHNLGAGQHHLQEMTYGKTGRETIWPVALAAFGGNAALGAGGGAGAGAATAAETAGTGTGAAAGTAATVDPFAASAGLGAEWASIGGTAAYPTLAGAGAASGVGGAVGGAGAAAPAASASWASTPWGQALLKGGLGLAAQKLLNGPTGAENRLNSFGQNDALSQAGIQQLLALLANPGGLGAGVSDAIRPRLAAESQNIAQNYRGIASNQAGAAARSNQPVSIRGALSSALDVAQERAQRAARGEALTASDTQRRAVLEAILSYISAGRSAAAQTTGMSAQLAQQRQAALLAMIGSLLTSGGKSGG